MLSGLEESRAVACRRNGCEPCVARLNSSRGSLLIPKQARSTTIVIVRLITASMDRSNTPCVARHNSCAATYSSGVDTFVQIRPTSECRLPLEFLQHEQGVASHSSLAEEVVDAEPGRPADRTTIVAAQVAAAPHSSCQHLLSLKLDAWLTSLPLKLERTRRGLRARDPSPRHRPAAPAQPSYRARAWRRCPARGRST